MDRKRVGASGFVLAWALAAGISNATAATAAAPPGAAADQATAERVVFGGFALEGNTAFSSATLEALVAGSVGQALTLAQIKAAGEQIAAYYHARGYTLASTVVPRQAFANGRPVQLMVLEGRLGATQVSGNKRFSTAVVEGTLRSYGVDPGKPVKLDDANRALVALNRRAGITATSTLKPGAAQGDTDIGVDIQEAPLVSGSYALNDYGSKDTGRWRNVLRLGLADATGRGDKLSAFGMKSMGAGNAYYGLLDYALPVGNHGTSVEAYVSGGNVDVGGAFNALNLKGRNTGLGLGVKQDQILSPRNILTWSAFLEGSDFSESLLGTGFVNDRVRKLRLGVSWDYTRLKSHTLASVDIHQGLGAALGGMPRHSAESSRPYAGADNHFTKITFDIAHLQSLTPRWSIMPRLYGQYAFNPLVSSEEFAIGGMNSVMGHPAGVFSGDSGYVALLEARFNVLPGDSRYQLIGTLSHGSTHIKRPFIDQRASENIFGLSFGLLANPTKKLSLRLDVGAPLGRKTENSAYVYAIAQYNF